MRAAEITSNSIFQESSQGGVRDFLHHSRGTGVGGAGENRTHDRGFADLGLTTWLPRHHANSRSLAGARDFASGLPLRSRPQNGSTWLPRPLYPGSPARPLAQWGGDATLKRKALAAAGLEIWSGRRDLNPRLRPWQGRTLPLSYSRSNPISINDLQSRVNGRFAYGEYGLRANFALTFGPP